MPQANEINAYEWGGEGELICYYYESKINPYLQSTPQNLWYAYSSVYYWILVAALHNADFILRLSCLCFTYILIAEFQDKEKFFRVVHFFSGKQFSLRIHGQWAYFLLFSQ
jgi:hypothetical protein